MLERLKEPLWTSVATGAVKAVNKGVIKLRIVGLCTVFAVLCGCASDEPYRVPQAATPSDYIRCDPSNPAKAPLIKQLDDHASLAFIEFTERGNLFNRGCVRRVYDYVEQTISEARAEGTSVSLVVFVHGWKHNAAPEDNNIAGFETILRGYTRDAELPASPALQNLPFQYKVDVDTTRTPRKVVGIYIGWRGGVFARWMPDFIKSISYWDRKAIAEEIGKGGVTEVLLSLGRIANCGSADVRIECAEDDLDNIYTVIGHSFGAAIVVAAMNEVIVQRLVNARPVANSSQGCIITRRLSDGVILLNPAIEANQLLQVKELITDHCFTDRQDVLMHVLSTAGDSATHTAFPIGQALGGLLTNSKDLVRADSQGRAPRELRESKLDTTTVGNFPGFWTGIMRRQNGDWHYRALTDQRTPTDMSNEPIPNHLWAPRNSPVQMIYTDRHFIEDHNKIFEPTVIAYTSAVMSESLALVRGKVDQVHPACFDGFGEFRFGQCFDYYLEQLQVVEDTQDD